jgi:MYXO-CTERM domain-containing protein
LLTAPQGNLGYADFAALLIAKIAAKLDAATGTALRTAYEERGIKKDEPRVIPYADPGIRSVMGQLGIHAPGTNDMPSGKKAEFAPNLFQIGYDAPAGGTTKVHVTFKMLQRGGAFGSGTGGALGGSSGTPFTPTIVGKLAEPIKFTYSPLTHDATATGTCTVAADKKSGTCDLELDVPGKYGETAKLMLMVGNKGQNGADLDSFVVTSEGPPEPAPTGPAADPTPTTETTTTSCGCTIPGASREGATATFALAALGLALASRRRR